MSVGSVYLSSPGSWWWVASSMLLVGLVLVVWSYRTAPAGVARWLCPALKALGIAALTLCLLEPTWSSQRAKPGANLLAIVADNSQGLRIKDIGEQVSRGDALAKLLDPSQPGWLSTLQQNFELRRYVFDRRLQATRDFSDLNFEGRSSAIGAALRTLADRYQGRPLAGVILLTDGNATDLRAAPELAGAPPIFPVVVGQSGRIRDIAVRQVLGSHTDFEDAPVNLETEVAATGYEGVTLVAQVIDEDGKQVGEQRLRAQKETEVLPFRFQLRPPRPGPAFYRVQVRARSDLDAAAAAVSDEATTANNNGYVVVNRGRGPYRILYVSGRPNWEFKFLNRALAEDNQVQLTALIRVAKREPRFNFIGRAGETSNPLFRGFGTQTPEEVERYDQPVLVRLNTRDPQELRTGFPRIPEDLYQYHAVIIDDLEAGFFTPDQASVLEKFVSERGGGLIMLGGMESFQNGNYYRTPIGDMLPVYLDRLDSTNTPGPLRFDLSREGWLQSWARLRDNEGDERARLESMTPFQVLNRVREVKPGASVVATVSDAEGKRFPALVTQRFGHGRTAALTVGDFWRWGFRDAEAGADLAKAWRQLARWLVSDSPNRVELTAQPDSETRNGAMILQVKVRDEKFQPLDDVLVVLQVRPVLADAPGESTNIVRLTAEPSASEPGVYTAAYLPRGPGAYRATVVATSAAGLQVGQAEAGWSTDLANEEFHSLTPNIALLEEIARKTGGEVLQPGDLPRFSRSLPFKHAPVMEPASRPLWHTPWVFGFALACFVSEWGLRRWKGLP